MTDQGIARRPRWLSVLLLVLCAALIVVFLLLGNWQMRRLAWKQDLIAAVETRAYGVPVTPPVTFDPEQHTYLRVALQGSYTDDAPVLVKAVTELGPGYWVMSPMQGSAGIVWVNRGFVPPGQKNPALWSAAPETISGLLRPTEPDGTLLERNDPGLDRWVSRDTAALSNALQLGLTMPYFIDADHTGAREAWPRGGLTIVRFRNTHLAYALTWYAMAALFAIALGGILWQAHRVRRGR